MNVKECDIPVPWGHIACKTYGNSDNPAVLLVHGVLDNLASFQTLLPLLPANYYYIAIDLPGHGRSSKFGGYLTYSTMNNVMGLKYVANYFTRDRYTIIAHSLGGQTSFLFTLIYPELVDKIVILDALFYIVTEPEHFLHRVRMTINYCMDEYRKHQNNPDGGKNTYEAALEKIQNQRRHDVLPRDVAEILAARGLESMGDGKYRFAADRLAGVFLNPLHDFDFLQKVLDRRPLKCPILVILTGEYDRQAKADPAWTKRFDYMSKWENVKIVHVEGAHDLHMYNPGRVAPFICDFLEPKSKL